MMTTRQAWPSADLWTKLARGEVTDASECPACGCPAATHQRDPIAGAFFCPTVATDADRARLREMVALATKRAGPAQRYAVNSRMFGDRAAREEMDRVVERLKSENADFELLRPFVIRIVARDPTIDLADALPLARKQLAERREVKRDLDLEREKRDQGRALAEQIRRATLSTPPRLRLDIDEKSFARQRDVQDRFERRQEFRATGRAAPKVPTVRTGKRQYSFEDE